MKKIIFIIAAFFGVLFGATSCQDILETESDRQIFDPELNEKTDSMFYTLGILKGLQQAIDQYVLVGEMRGDLTDVNYYSETDLRELANFSADATNKYDSAYLYYRIINNCNYYIAHRDTSLRTGSRQVALLEYAQAHSIRAWAYLQLAKTYGTVPFFTEPITSISEANQTREKKDLQGIVDALAPELAKYAGYGVPNYGDIDAGKQQSGGKKIIRSQMCMLPVDLVLGDLYLETNQYELAAKSYFNYIKNNSLVAENYGIAPQGVYPNRRDLPNNMSLNYSRSWSSIFSYNQTVGYSDIITYVPMAVNKYKGEITNLPALFGFDYYTTSISLSANDSTTNYVSTDMYLEDRQIDPSQSYLDLADEQEFYYANGSSSQGTIVSSVSIGDMRRYVTLESITKDDSTFNVMTKFSSANIPVYRGTTVYLRLAEALNRMGYPDAAFMLLKDGVNSTTIDTNYVKPATIEMLTNVIPFLSTENRTTFYQGYGIHSHGSYYTRGASSPYQMNTIVGKKLTALSEQYGIVPTYTINDTINAVEDLICDEYALEFAFEGNRFGDLCRIARHKNASSLYMSNFGGIWLRKKLEYKNPVVDLSDENNWYLPFN